MTECSHLNAIDCAGRAATRAAAVFLLNLRRGTTSLRTVACIAPLLGMIGSTVLAMDLLRSYSITFNCCGDCACGGPSEAFVPLVLSLPLAILTRAGFHWLSHQVETFDLEMRTATLALLNDLSFGPVHRPPK